MWKGVIDMAEKLCELKKKGGGGGGKQTETVLWTNSAPTSSFASQSVTLSDNINNYDYLKFTIAFSTSVADSSSTIISVSDFKKMTSSASTGHPVGFVGGRYTNIYSRAVYYTDDTTVNFGSNYQQGASTVANTNIIPIQIVGIKNMGGKIDNKTVSGTVSVTAGGISSTIDVGFRPKKLYVYAYISSTGIITCAYDESVSPNAYIRGVLYGANKLDDFVSFGNSNGIASIEDNGFKIYCNLSQLVGTWHYTAIKE